MSEIKNIDGTEHMLNDIKEKVQTCKNSLRDHIHDNAEKYAEQYIAFLGLPEEDPFNANIKKQYHDEFVEQLMQVIK